MSPATSGAALRSEPTATSPSPTRRTSLRDYQTRAQARRLSRQSGLRHRRKAASSPHRRLNGGDSAARHARPATPAWRPVQWERFRNIRWADGPSSNVRMVRFEKAGQERAAKPPFYYWRFVRASTGSMPRNRRLARRPVSRKVVDRTITRGRRPDVWLTLSGWLWLIYFVGVTTGAIRWLL
jgi:hypothetical protein